MKEFRDISRDFGIYNRDLQRSCWYWEMVEVSILHLCNLNWERPLRWIYTQTTHFLVISSGDGRLKFTEFEHKIKDHHQLNINTDLDY